MLRYRPGAAVEATWRPVAAADDGGGSSGDDGTRAWEPAVVENDLPHLETVLVRFRKNRAWARGCTAAVPPAALPPLTLRRASRLFLCGPLAGTPVELPRDAVRPAIGAPVERGRRHNAPELPWELNIFDFDGTLFRSPVLDPVRWRPPAAGWPSAAGRAERRGALHALARPVLAQMRWENAARDRFYAKPGRYNGLGWFQHPASLSPPFVPEVPGPEWFNPAVVRERRRGHGQAGGDTESCTLRVRVVRCRRLSASAGPSATAAA